MTPDESINKLRKILNAYKTAAPLQGATHDMIMKDGYTALAVLASIVIDHKPQLDLQPQQFITEKK